MFSSGPLECPEWVDACCTKIQKCHKNQWGGLEKNRNRCRYEMLDVWGLRHERTLSKIGCVTFCFALWTLYPILSLFLIDQLISHRLLWTFAIGVFPNNKSWIVLGVKNGKKETTKRKSHSAQVFGTPKEYFWRNLRFPRPIIWA
jgi:hypothetical protein